MLWGQDEALQASRMINPSHGRRVFNPNIPKITGQHSLCLSGEAVLQRGAL